jgi:carboxyl-terminal processing protease
MPRWNLGWILGISAVVLLGYTVSLSAPPRERDRDYELVRLVVDVLEEVDHKYVRPLDPEAKRKLVEDMLNGGLERLDPHSTFINSHEYKRFTLSNRGKFGGIGIQILPERDNRRSLVVSSPIVDTPAYDAGVLAGDVILKIDGKATESMRLSEAIDMIQGEPGSKIVLSVLHLGEKEPVELEMKRAEIRVQSVLGDQRRQDNLTEWDYFIDKSAKIAYVRVSAFNETTGDELRKVLTDLKKDGVHGLILDLRNNPGGLLRTAVDVSRMFVKEGRIVSTKGRNQQEEAYDARRDQLVLGDEDPLMAVLVNSLSASASEIVAAALQDHKRAVIIGERTYGKGSVQNIIEMENSTSALKLTTASYWRPSGKNIHRFPDSKDNDEWGVRPNPSFEITLDDQERLAYFDHRRERDVVPGKKPPRARAANDTNKPKTPYVDRILDKAMDYMRGQLQKKAAMSVSGLPLAS